MRTHCQSRGGFTLVELLVVMALIAILAALTIAFFPNAANSNREAKAATLVQGWLNIAKQRAQRDQAPRGLRLLWQSPSTLQVVECQYIEQPDVFPAGLNVAILTDSPKPPVTLNTLGVIFQGGDLQNGYVPTLPPYQTNGQPNPSTDQPLKQPYWTVQPGDSLEIFGTGLPYTITEVGVWDYSAVPSPVYHQSYIRVDPPLAYRLDRTTNFRIYRAPRAVAGESLKLPDGTVIDLVTNAAFNNPVPSGLNYTDILFSPNGSVITRGQAASNIHLWVRAPNEDTPSNPFLGSPTIVSVFVRTGFVGAYKPDVPSTTPVVGYPYSQVR